MYNQNFLCGWACPLQSCVYNVSTTDRSTVYKHQIETHKKSRSTVLPPIPLFPGEIPQLENPSWLPHGCAGLYVNDHPREDDIDCVNCNRPAYLCARWGVPTMARYWGDDCPWREPTDWQWNRERQKLLETSEKYAEDSYYDTYGKYDSAPNGPPLWGSIGSEPLRW
ncbi:hypothetical protein M501DRAFT_515790 [Patellaria atrata CBS 101060]|uniref:Uncharacterized protein n=1 Tax=Patellaria atrata CBS 101060 TaxID=1346257 RepID=A0A9P4S1S4_9PEZI|nr:hypothetical protein M501DRAFT_515790 [Patellaria atrata CBS 101060]